MRSTDYHAQDDVLSGLLEQGVVTHEEVERARQAAQQDGLNDTVTYHLVKLEIVKPSTLLEFLSQRFRADAIDLSKTPVEERAVNLINGETAMRYRAIPVSRDGSRLVVAMANPRDVEAIDAIRYASQLAVTPMVADLYSISQQIDRHYNQTDEGIKLVMEEFDDLAGVAVINPDEEEDPLAAIQEEIESAPVVRLINGILHDAVRRNASDIHIEPFERRLRIRFRIDGALQEVASPPITLRDAVTSRIKIMSGLNIGERRVPQDGRTKLRIGNRTIDFRVNTTPSAFGEKTVLRILDKNAVSLDIETLGIDPRGLEIIMRTLASPYGMIVSTGPTGSGKTTTLYSMLTRLNNDEVNIMSVEDPIEYNLDGITQVQVKSSIGLTFAKVLRSFLRQDPDIIMVGEVRDSETAEIAIQAALTGHMVLSTLHTNDAVSAFARLLDMGVERFYVASSMSTIIAQRLVRRVCTKCARPVQYKSSYLQFARLTPEEIRGARFVKGEGCDACDGVGYSGRIGLFEVLEVTQEIQDLIMTDAPMSKVKDVAIRQGMKTLRDIGIEKAREGLTTLEEVMKATLKNG